MVVGERFVARTAIGVVVGAVDVAFGAPPLPGGGVGLGAGALVLLLPLRRRGSAVRAEAPSRMAALRLPFRFREPLLLLAEFVEVFNHLQPPLVEFLGGILRECVRAQPDCALPAIVVEESYDVGVAAGAEGELFALLVAVAGFLPDVTEVICCE